MQRIERYGVIALVFLLVTILAVSLWGEGAGLGAADPADPVETASQEKPEPKPNAATRTSPVRRGGQKAPPISNDSGSNDSTNPTVADAKPRGGRAAREGRSEPRTSGAQNALPTPTTTRGSNRTAQRETPREEPVQSQPKPRREEPAPRATKPATRSGGSRVYVVQSGETLSEIAQNELGTYKRWPEIQALNGGIDPAAVRAGMKLTMPARGAAVATATPPSKKPATAPAKTAPKVNGNSYVVQRGDVLSVIAQRELGSSKRWREIVALNPGVDPERLAVGTRLSLPGGAQKSMQIAKADTSSRARSGSASSSKGSKVR